MHAGPGQPGALREREEGKGPCEELERQSDYWREGVATQEHGLGVLTPRVYLLVDGGKDRGTVMARNWLSSVWKRAYVWRGLFVNSVVGGVWR